MTHEDVMRGVVRPFGLGYWPLAEDDPGVAVQREAVRLVSPNGALVRGVLSDSSDRDIVFRRRMRNYTSAGDYPGAYGHALDAERTQRGGMAQGEAIANRPGRGKLT